MYIFLLDQQFQASKNVCFIGLKKECEEIHFTKFVYVIFSSIFRSVSTIQLLFFL
jgi:hypothetical protein